MKLVMEKSPANKVLFNMKSQLKMLMARGVFGTLFRSALFPLPLRLPPPLFAPSSLSLLFHPPLSLHFSSLPGYRFSFTQNAESTPRFLVLEFLDAGKKKQKTYSLLSFSLFSLAFPFLTVFSHWASRRPKNSRLDARRRKKQRTLPRRFAPRLLETKISYLRGPEIRKIP